MSASRTQEKADAVFNWTGFPSSLAIAVWLVQAQIGLGEVVVSDRQPTINTVPGVGPQIWNTHATSDPGTEWCRIRVRPQDILPLAGSRTPFQTRPVSRKGQDDLAPG
ncbi:hypothetical protein V8F33_004484 [Rhypophila sp. PSN 637]